MTLSTKKKEILRRYVLMVINGQIGSKAMTRHNSKERGIIHHYMCKGFHKEDIYYMMSVLTNLGNKYILEDDLEIIDLDGKTVFDEVKSKRYLQEFMKKIKELKEK